MQMTIVGDLAVGRMRTDGDQRAILGGKDEFCWGLMLPSSLGHPGGDTM